MRFEIGAPRQPRHGAIDTHVHANPTRDDGFVLDDFELVQEYEEAGLDGVVIKCHEFGSFFRSKIAQKYAVKGDAFKVYGSICLNYGVGGLNPVAVEAALTAGAKTVFMPTLESQNGFQIWDSSIPYQHFATEICGQPMRTLEGLPGVTGMGLCPVDMVSPLIYAALSETDQATNVAGPHALDRARVIRLGSVASVRQEFPPEEW